MTSALVERGIGATRALVLDGDTVIGAHIERDDGGPRAGAIHVGRLATILVPGRRGIVRLGDGEALLEPLPRLAEGGLLRVEVVREAVPEVARPRLAKLRAIDGPAAAPGEVQPGPDLMARLAVAGHAVTMVGGLGADRLEAAGWSEAVEAARTGHVAFPGGLLTISPTPGMTVIDVDGPGDPVVLAEAAAHAAAVVIRRFDLAGSIGIDFPTVTGKAARNRLGEILDAALPAPFERTAVNGFGFIQIVRPRLRASLVESVRAPGFAALELLRRAGRGDAGARTLVAHPVVANWLVARPALIEALSRQVGGAVRLQADAALAISAGDVH
ncbi:ribonuclease [Sandarakinorhabdus sp. DWP1-3-1]|uniref:ribonuclease n=1 Tax=Sandarakinorhabdus sp. DWP1-3-1 TaxID=2804627 RepID=UPI003CFADC91